MRYLLFIFLLILTTAQAKPSAKGELQGTWIPIRQETNGKLLPNAMLRGQKMVIKDDTFTLTAPMNYTGKVTYSNGKLDVEGTDNNGVNRRIKGIYKFVNKQLFICLNILGQAYPADYETLDRRGVALFVFKKQAGK